MRQVSGGHEIRPRGGLLLPKFSGELEARGLQLPRKFRHLRVQNQRVLSVLHAWAVQLYALKGLYLVKIDS